MSSITQEVRVSGRHYGDPKALQRSNISVCSLTLLGDEGAHAQSQCMRKNDAAKLGSSSVVRPTVIDRTSSSRCQLGGNFKGDSNSPVHSGAASNYYVGGGRVYVAGVRASGLGGIAPYDFDSTVVYSKRARSLTPSKDTDSRSTSIQYSELQACAQITTIPPVGVLGVDGSDYVAVRPTEGGSANVTMNLGLKKRLEGPSQGTLLKVWSKSNQGRRIVHRSAEKLTIHFGSDLKLQLYNQRAKWQILLSSLSGQVTQIRNRCLLTNRSRSVYRKFGLTRMMLKHWINHGLICGFRKRVW